jgi:four helix bundle protein
MSQLALESFGAYQKARELFDLVVEDMAQIMKDPRCYRLIGQQVASADSICANIEEGYGRLSRPEYIRFLDFARGSARETRGRYDRMKHWLTPDVTQRRAALADEIIAILTKTIDTLQRSLQKPSSSTSQLKEETPAYGVTPEIPPSTLDIRHSPPPPTPHH